MIRLNTKERLVVTILVLLLALSPAAYAENISLDESANKKNKTEKTERNKTAEKRKEILKEATNAISNTRDALKLLDEKKEKEALKALENASGKLQIILARDPGLSLAPANVTSATYNILSSIAEINVIRDRAEDALEDGRLQEARRLIRNLASETVVSVTNIPLATYPSAISLAAKSIDKGNFEEAKNILQTALNTLVITETIIPLPVVHAEGNLKQAEILAEKAERNKEENERLAGFLKSARSELKFAEALGYSSKKNFKHLYEQINQIEKKTQEGKAEKGFFARIKSFLKDVMSTSQSENPTT